MTSTFVSPTNQSKKALAAYRRGNKNYLKKAKKLGIPENGKKDGRVCEHILLIDLPRLVYDNAYRFGIRESYFSDLINNFSMKKLDPIVLNFRDNRLVIVDGVRRVKAAHALGMDILPAIVYNNLSEKEETHLHIELNRRYPTLSSKERFLILAKEDDSLATQMQAIFDNYNFVVRPRGKHAKDSHYTIESLCEILNGAERMLEDNTWSDWLTWCFDLFATCNWSPLVGCTSGRIIRALANVYIKHSKLDTLDDATDNLISVMAVYGPEHLAIVADSKFFGIGYGAAKRSTKMFLDIADGTYTVKNINRSFKRVFGKTK